MNRLRLPLGTNRSSTATVVSGKMMLMRLLIGLAIKMFRLYLQCTHYGCVCQSCGKKIDSLLPVSVRSMACYCAMKIAAPTPLMEIELGFAG